MLSQAFILSSWLKGIVAPDPSDKMWVRHAAMLSITAATPSSPKPPILRWSPDWWPGVAALSGAPGALHAVLQEGPEAVVTAQYHATSAKLTRVIGVRKQLLSVGAGVAT
jgi:hypothetical protein